MTTNPDASPPTSALPLKLNSTQRPHRRLHQYRLLLLHHQLRTCHTPFDEAATHNDTTISADLSTVGWGCPHVKIRLSELRSKNSFSHIEYHGSGGDSDVSGGDSGEDDEGIGGGGSDEDDEGIGFSGRINLSSDVHHVPTPDQKGGRRYVLKIRRR